MSIEHVAKLLKNATERNITTSDKVRLKIQMLHGLDFEEIVKHLLDQEALEASEEQESRNENERIFRLIFRLSSQKRLCVVITEKSDGMIFVVTAFVSSKKLDKLIKTQTIRRR
jgi:uncharacterized DUF497 family protein